MPRAAKEGFWTRLGNIANHIVSTVAAVGLIAVATALWTAWRTWDKLVEHDVDHERRITATERKQVIYGKRSAVVTLMVDRQDRRSGGEGAPAALIEDAANELYGTDRPEHP